MPTIVISYRRSDTSAIAGRIFDRLAAHYGEDSVFIDIDNIPLGVDFRTHIQETLRRTDVFIAVIGVNWLGVSSSGTARIQENTDPVRMEVQTAVERSTPIIPLLVDGAKMPNSTDLPSEFGNFAFLNAAEVVTGRDFRTQMDRVIAAIDQTLTGGVKVVAPRLKSARARSMVTAEEISPKQWFTDIVWYFVAPLVLLLAAHHVVVNLFDLNIRYLWASSTVVPLLYGFTFFWINGRGAGLAFAFAIALGIVGIIGMTISQSLNSGDPIVPQTRFEWWDNFNFAAVITLSFVVGNTTARLLRRALSSNRSASL